MAELQIINIGTTANDGQGDPLRVAFEKVNNNFSNLWASNFNTNEAITFGNTANQLIFSAPVDSFVQATFQINTNDQNSSNSQSIVINAALNIDQTQVRWTGHSTIFNGDPVTQYNMDVVDGNVNLYVNPLVSTQLNHLVVAQVTNTGAAGAVTNIVLNQSNDNLGTENLQNIITEN